MIFLLKKKLNYISNFLKKKSPLYILKKISKIFYGKIIFSTSFSIEDQVISHIIFDNKIPIDVFTIDTGRLFPETYEVWDKTNKRYKTNIKTFFPYYKLIENLIYKNGPNSFLNSIEKRKKCCFLRKIEPFKRGIKNKYIWITGIRYFNSYERRKTKILEWDNFNKIIKFHPLLYCKINDIINIINKFNIPYNFLYKKGFISIGCSTCTRSIKFGESKYSRNGRWWWEKENKKECGLHPH